MLVAVLLLTGFCSCEKMILDSFVRCAEDLRLITVMVSQHGKLLQKYNWDDDCRRNIYSASKSFTSAAVGIAQREGLLSIDEKLTELPVSPLLCILSTQYTKGKVPKRYFLAVVRSGTLVKRHGHYIRVRS